MKNNHTLRIAVIIGAVVMVLIAITLLIIWLVMPRQHVLDVKLIQWEYTIQIQEYRTVHEFGWSSPPDDAYNVQKENREHGTEKIQIDDVEIKVPRYDTWYEYDIDMWIDNRIVMTTGTDKSPYWGEYELRQQNGSTISIGDERVSANIEEYTVSGTESDCNELITVSVSRDIWEQLTTNDQLIYLQRAIGDPYDIRIAE